jgi:hypothetical protein
MYFFLCINQTLADRLTNMAGKNALLQAKREQLKNAIAAFKGQVAGGQYDFDSTAPNAVVPNFYDVVRGLYTGSSTSSSSSSSSSSSTSSALFTLSEDEAAQHRNHEYVQAVREELRLAPEPNGEDEFFVVNTKGNLKHEVTCPITQCVMEQPVTCKLCKHSYDQAAVLELLKKKKGTMSCPIGGCGKMFKEGDLEKSAALERKLKKYKKEQERASQNDAGSDAEMLDV